jgi:superfamily I DNA and/or RNA helicase
MSIGYGPDENGQVKMDFRPLTRHGGWRRLNVAITRARHRLEIITSIRPGDIPDSAGKPGSSCRFRICPFDAQVEAGWPTSALTRRDTREMS